MGIENVAIAELLIEVSLRMPKFVSLPGCHDRECDDLDSSAKS